MFGEGGGDRDLLSMMELMLAKLDTLTTEVTSLKRTVRTANSRISELENKKSEPSEISDENSDGNNSQNSKSGSKIKSKVGSTGKSKVNKVKQDRVLEDKQRTLKIMLDSLIDNNKKKKNEEESEVEMSSDEEANARDMQKKMSSKQKSKAEKIVAKILKLVGGDIPEEEEDNNRSSDSGTDNDSIKSKSSRSKVKSGAKVKKRPVVRTELWPHTIANEDDGADLTSETINLAKFMACFSKFLITCEGAEVAGRAVLLYAITLVLECLPWPEARLFHNVVMVKIEQGRIDWSTDFSELAEQYLNKKVRLGMRARINNAAGAAPRSNYGNNGGRGYGNNYGRPRYYNRNEFTPGRYRGSNSVVCRQWNGGTCYYGQNCRKQHCCLTCFDEGKPGVDHKASFHGTPQQARGTSTNQQA